MRPGGVSHLRLWINYCYNSIDEGGDIAEVIREAFTDVLEQLNRLRKVSYFVPDTHCTVNGLRKHTNRKFCKQAVSLSLSHTSLTTLERRPCKNSASCSLWCERETSSVAASNKSRSIHVWYMTQGKETAKKVELCSGPHRYVADVAQQRLQGAQGIRVLR